MNIMKCVIYWFIALMLLIFAQKYFVWYIIGVAVGVALND